MVEASIKSAPSMIQAIIFDLDGVLLDSMPSSYRVKTKLFAQHGIALQALPDPHNQQHKGSSFEGIMALVGQHYPHVAIDKAVFKKVMLGEIIADLRDRRITADIFLVDFLDDLKRQRIPCAVASAGLREGVMQKLQLLGIADYFTVIVTADDVTEHKPHPRAYLYAAEQLGVDAKQCVVFEDSRAGVAAAHAAGATVIGFSKYASQKKKLTYTMCTVDSWQDMSLAYLNKLLYS